MGALEAPQDKYGQEHRTGTSRVEQTDRDHGGAGSSGSHGGAGSSGGHRGAGSSGDHGVWFISFILATSLWSIIIGRCQSTS